MVILLLMSVLSHAVWLDDIYGNPPKSYFLAHQKFLEWGVRQGKLSDVKKRELEACLKQVDGWYLPDSREPQFEVRIGVEAKPPRAAHSEEVVRYRWICKNPKQTKMGAEQPFVAGALPGHPLAALISHHRKISELEYSFELRAYIDWEVPADLLLEIRKIHEEFGFLADTWHHSKDYGLEVAFP